MKNTYSFHSNSIVIQAPGSANENRIKNALIWDINGFLKSKFDLYTFFVCKKPVEAAICRPYLGFPKKYIVFQKLDDMFIKYQEVDDAEIRYYRELMDPLRKMSDDVFAEACCLENVDIEYVAVENIQHLFGIKAQHRLTTLDSWISSMFPVYISLFGAKEVRMFINNHELIKPILDIVMKYCVEKE